MYLDYVLLGRRPYKERFEDFTKEDFEIVTQNLKIIGIYDFINKKLDQVSGGEL
ncbi:MAG: hypothetical protein U9N10_06100 [Bacillota bacterium]|nr:hypothetical protein [Bacillota bacterium]